tara:strand:+ start:1534 stop:1791 length:258 start_codon:yes stop_codon:yes gene_type:complete
LKKELEKEENKKKAIDKTSKAMITKIKQIVTAIRFTNNTLLEGSKNADLISLFEKFNPAYIKLKTNIVDCIRDLYVLDINNCPFD